MTRAKHVTGLVIGLAGFGLGTGIALRCLVELLAGPDKHQQQAAS